ncbi:MAG: cupredoxin domain-containing protein [Bdellovibrionales bacterium]|nr:cupredoxin domain-containing protein [Bdellovibrionales bacterium]
MNLQIFIQDKNFIRRLLACSILLFAQVGLADWSIDFSRRAQNVKPEDIKMDYNKSKSDAEKSVFETVFEASTPVQELVILNTETGFVPASIHLKVGKRYKFNVVNVNKNNKNLSFVMDAFSEHHSTYYGALKSFTIQPKKEGVYSFQCPESSAQGRLVVYPETKTQPSLSQRLPASDGGSL